MKYLEKVTSVLHMVKSLVCMVESCLTDMHVTLGRTSAPSTPCTPAQTCAGGAALAHENCAGSAHIVIGAFSSHADRHHSASHSSVEMKSILETIQSQDKRINSCKMLKYDTQSHIPA